MEKYVCKGKNENKTSLSTCECVHYEGVNVHVAQIGHCSHTVVSTTGIAQHQGYMTYPIFESSVHAFVSGETIRTSFTTTGRGKRIRSTCSS